MSEKRMKKGHSKAITPEQEAELARLASMPDDEIDTGDIPEVRDWSGAKRGLFYRPIKKQLTLRVDADVLDYFRATGKGWQSRMNAALRKAMKERADA
jgi:uncharacterized protein (DUF4415 family)